MPSSPLRELHKCQKTILAVGDLHAPFMHADAVDFVAWLKRKWKPDETVFLGDEIDGHAVSAYGHDPDGYSAGHELKASIDSLRPFYAMFPNAKVCNSNHTARYYRKAFDAGIPERAIKPIRDILDAPAGWEWSDHWDIDGIRYEHGEGYSGAAAAIKSAEGNQRSTVIGHVHSHAAVTYYANAETLLFGFNVGVLIDWKLYAFRYGKHYKRKPIVGAGVIVKGLPIFVPMLLDKRGRWIGRGKK